MPSKPATVEKKKDVSGLEPPRRPARSKKPCEAHSTARDDRNAPAPWRRLGNVVSFPGYVARLSAQLLGENGPAAGARAWGDR